MKLLELIAMDCSDPESLELLKEKLVDTPMFKTTSSIDINSLERVYFTFIKRYSISISSIMPSISAMYVMFIHDSRRKENVKVLHAKFYEEGLMKCLLYMYYYCKGKKEMKI